METDLTSDRFADRLASASADPGEPQPHRNHRSNGHPKSAQDIDGGPRFDIVRGSDIKPTQVEWVWQGKVPLRKLSLLAGPPGDGKTLFGCAYVPSVVTTGQTWSDGAPAPPIGEVLIISQEDGIEDTLVPRLIEHGADMSKVHFLKSRLIPAGKGPKRALQLDVVRDEDAFSAELSEKYRKVSYIVADPITEAAGQFKSNDNIATRLAMAPFVRIAEKHNLAVLGITHFSKSVVGSALTRCIGSTAFVALARVCWCIVRDREDPERCLLLPLKCNIARQPPGLSFRIVEPGRIEWEGETSLSADEAIGDARGNPSGKLESAKTWLIKRLSAGSCRSVELFIEAEQAGHAERTIWRARQTLLEQIETSKMRGQPHGVFLWSLKRQEGAEPF